MENDWLQPLRAGIYTLTEADLSSVTNWAWALQGRTTDAQVRFLRGVKMQTVEKLFDEVSAALQFPYYFGENWGAFDECLADLEWIDSRRLVVVVTDTDSVLQQEEEEQTKILIDCMRSSYSELEVEDRTLSFVLQSRTKDSLPRLVRFLELSGGICGRLVRT